MLNTVTIHSAAPTGYRMYLGGYHFKVLRQGINPRVPLYFWARWRAEHHNDPLVVSGQITALPERPYPSDQVEAVVPTPRVRYLSTESQQRPRVRRIGKEEQN